MARGIRRAIREVMGVQVGLLRDAPPFRVEQRQRREAIRVGGLEYPIVFWLNISSSEPGGEVGKHTAG
jgi:hypothetical protein